MPTPKDIRPDSIVSHEETTKDEPKFKFEPKEHLVQKLRDHEGLQALAASLKQNKEQNHKRSTK